MRREPQRLLCFYCGNACTLNYAARPRTWKCPTCEVVNHVDELGNIIDAYAPNGPTHLRYAEARPWNAAPVPFCQACLRNHALVRAALASYGGRDDDDIDDDDDDDDDDDEAEEQADSSRDEPLYAYKRLLEERYPPVCRDCAPFVKEALQRNNYTVKSYALGKWLHRSQHSDLSHRQGSLWKHVLLTIWLVRGCTHVLAIASSLAWSLLSICFPSLALSTLRDAAPTRDSTITFTTAYYNGSLRVDPAFAASFYIILRRMTAWTLVCMLWDPCGSIRIRNPRTQIVNRSVQRHLQMLIFIVRVLHVYALAPCDVRTYWIISICCIIVEALGSLLALRATRAVEERPLSLADDADRLDEMLLLRTSESRQQRHHDEAIRHNLESLELDFDARTDSQTIKDRLEHMARLRSLSVDTAAVNAPAVDDPMVVDTADTSMQHPPPLAPQRFFPPDEPTGLETLFSTSLGLDDEPAAVGRTAGGLSSSSASVLMLLGVSVLLRVGLLLALWAPETRLYPPVTMAALSILSDLVVEFSVWGVFAAPVSFVLQEAVACSATAVPHVRYSEACAVVSFAILCGRVWAKQASEKQPAAQTTAQSTSLPLPPPAPPSRLQSPLPPVARQRPAGKAQGKRAPSNQSAARVFPQR